VERPASLEHRAQKKVLRATEQQRPDVQQKRRWWEILMSPQRADRLVFIDETGASTKMARRYGWGPRGQRVVGDVPHGHWKTTTFVGALRISGMTAPMVIDGAMNGDLFLAYVEQQLVPTPGQSHVGGSCLERVLHEPGVGQGGWL
jgi:hypothetical protein